MSTSAPLRELEEGSSVQNITTKSRACVDVIGVAAHAASLQVEASVGCRQITYIWRNTSLATITRIKSLVISRIREARSAR